MIQHHQTQSLRTIADAQHSSEALKQLIEEYEEIELGWEEMMQTRERVYSNLSGAFAYYRNELKVRVEKLEKLIG